MLAGSHTPLLDYFRRGDVTREVRLIAAQGALAPRAHEQLGLLMLLVADHDREIAAAAEVTLASIPRGSLEAFLARSDVPDETRRFFAARNIFPSAVASTDVEMPLIDASPAVESATEEDTPADARAREASVTRIAAMNVAQRIALAMKGSREERAILIRDNNRVVAISVLSSPRLTEMEVETIARMANVSDEVLRTIAATRTWMKNYAVCSSLTRNPKTPVGISMNLISRLNDRDMKMLSIDRNVPEVLRITARKKLARGSG